MQVVRTFATRAQPQQNSLGAAALVIGDEILSGAIQDSNTPWLAQLLHSQGVDMVRFEYVPDDVAEIKAALQRLKARVGETGVIFTSGVQLCCSASSPLALY